MHWKDMPLRTRAIWLNVGALLLALGVFVTLDLVLERVRVNGSLYQDINRGHQLVADILPPPQYIIETRLVTYELMEASQQADAPTFQSAVVRLRALRKEFETRHAYWQKVLPPGPLRDTLLDRAHASAKAFFDVTQTEYLPRLLAGDIAGGRRVLFHQLLPLFQAHREQIDQAVAIAVQENKAREERAAAIVSQMRWGLLGGGLLAVSLSWWVLRRWWIRPVVAGVAQVRQELEAIGRGELHATGTSPGPDHEDEFGQILHCVDQMRGRLRELVESLERQREIAEDASRAKGDFLANMSHEIRTPMNGIIGLTQLLRRTTLTAQQRDYLDKVRQSSESLLRIINDILDFSKIEADKLELEHENLQLQDVLSRVVSVVGFKAQEKNLELLFDVGRHVPVTLQGDGLRLSQVLINLCANAIKFTDHGEVMLSVRRVRTSSDTITLSFSVQDTGIGMTPAQVAELFQPFRQADASTTRRFGGTGLGLAISKRLVELMQGHFEVQSEPDRGSTFTFTACFGLSRAALAASAEQRDQASAFAGVRALVIDDNLHARGILRDLLETLGLQVTSATTVEEALRARQAGGDGASPMIDVILLDGPSPDLACQQAVAMLRAAWPSSHIILTTHRSDEALAQRAVALGLSGSLTKPITSATLMDALSTAISPDLPRPRPLDRRIPSIAPPASLRGRRVLLVEDNEFNQLIAREMMSTYAGMEVTQASNGAEAVELIRQHDFDVVLMDVQMPVMDGYQAVALVRQDPRHASLPIIAMTAHAMVRDRERCIQVGMNAYVTKPFDPQELFAVLEKWSAASSRPASPPSPSSAGSPGPGAPSPVSFDLGLERCMGRVDLFEKIVRRYLETRLGDPPAIGQAVAEGRMEAASAMAHSAISTAGALGADELAARARSLQQAIDRNEQVRIPALLERFAQEHEAVAQALRRYMERQHAGQAAELH